MGEEKRGGVAGVAVPGRGGLAGQAVRVEMTLQESCSPRLQPHLSYDDPATRLKKKIIIMSFLALPYPTKAMHTLKQYFDPVSLSFISLCIPSQSTRVRSGAGAPQYGSASRLRLRWGRRGPLGESEGLCFLWLLWNSLSFLPPSHPSPPPW